MAFTALVGCGGGNDSDNVDNNSQPVLQKSNAVTSLGLVGIGVENLAESVTFFEDGLGMVELERIARSDRTEVIMQAANGRGAKLALMEFNDGVERDYESNPGKFVFYTDDATTLADNIEAVEGAEVSFPPAYDENLGVTVGFARGVDRNLIEMVEVSEDGTYLSAIGIGVSNLEDARDFYVGVVGFEEDQFLAITGFYDEYILTSTVENTPALVIMTWAPSRNQTYTDKPVKILLNTDDPEELASAIENSGFRVTQAPSASEEADLEGLTVGYAKDADGTVIEIRDSAE